MVAGLLGNESSDSNRFTLVTPKSENDVRLQATLGNQNPTGLPVGVVSGKSETFTKAIYGFSELGCEIIPYELLDDIYDVVTKEDIVVDYIYQCE